MILEAEFSEQAEVLHADFGGVSEISYPVVTSLSFEKMYAISASEADAPSDWETVAPTTTDDKPYLWMRTIVSGVTEDGTQFRNDDNGIVVGVRGKTGGKGDTPVKGEDYWTAADQESIAKKAAETLTATAGIVNPDKFSGTDSEKLQAAFDALSTSGGVISINRAYTLTASIKVSHDSSANNNLITVKGDGQNAKIDFGAYCFQGADTTKSSYGGIIFKDLWLSGTGVGFNCTHLIRLTFDNCMIRNFSNFLYSTEYLQSVYIMGCYIRVSASGLADGSVKETINATNVCDLKIIGCVCEQGYRLISAAEIMDGCSITDCCIEGYKSTPIVLGTKNRGVNICNTYFESNQGTSIDLTNATDWCGVSIRDNWFCEWNGEEVKGAIILPTGFANGCLSVVGNHCPYPERSLLLKVPDGADDLSKVYAFSNVGITNDPAKVKMLMPDDINNMKLEFVMGEDYWTPDDREQAINEVLAMARGNENWIFTLADGTLVERLVPVGIAEPSYTSEAWVFTLNDGSTVTKGVAIV